MATMTISLPDQMKDWIEAQIKRGEYASSSDYVRDLIRRDKERRARPELTIEDLRQIVEASRASGRSEKSISDILAEARREAEANGPLNG